MSINYRKTFSICDLIFMQTELSFLTTPFVDTLLTIKLIFFVIFILTPNALKRLRRGCGSCLFRKTSDLGLGGFLGRIMTRVSSLISSSNNLLSDETDNCLWTRSWWSLLSVLRQSAKKKKKEEKYSWKL